MAFGWILARDRDTTFSFSFLLLNFWVYAPGCDGIYQHIITQRVHVHVHSLVNMGENEYAKIL